jgi:hypothetical protein
MDIEIKGDRWEVEQELLELITQKWWRTEKSFVYLRSKKMMIYPFK